LRPKGSSGSYSGFFENYGEKVCVLAPAFYVFLKVEEGFSDGEGHARQSGNSGFTD
jgi:hypothetical protein